MARPAGRPTSRDVARLAGVSQTTVSLVINEVPTVSITEETRSRVRSAVLQLDYHPHDGARSLSRKATRTIGVAIPDAGNPHYMEITEAIETYAEAHGYSIVLIVTNYDLARERRCLQWLKQQRMDTLILCTSPSEAIEQEIRAAREQGFQVTTFLENMQAAWGVCERELLEHLVGLGHRRIGYIHGVADHKLFGDRLHACLRIQRDLGVPVVESWIRRCGPGIDDGFEATRALLAACKGGERPTALIVINDLLAIGVLAALHGAALSVPGQLSVAAFDNTRLARYSVPPLTSVDPQARLLGEHVARTAFDRMAEPSRASVHADIVPRLVVRGSTGPAPDTIPDL